MSLFNSEVKDKQGCVPAVLALPSHISGFRVLLYRYLDISLGYFLIVLFSCFSYVRLTCGLFLKAIVIISKEPCISGPDPLLPLYLTLSPVVSLPSYPVVCWQYVFIFCI